MTARHISARRDLLIHNTISKCQWHPPLPLSEGCGHQPTGVLGVEKREGGPRKWEAQAVHRENRQRQKLLPVFFHSFFLHPPLTPVTPKLPPLPPPLCPNASQRRLLSSFRCDCHHHHLPLIQTRAGGGPFRRFDTTPTTTTSLTSKRELEVVLPTPLPPPPPPSHSNMSRRWSFSSFQHLCHHHHLPRVQTRARGSSFCCFNMTPTTTTSLTFKRKSEVVHFVVSTRLPHHHLPHVQMRAGGGSFHRFDTTPTTTTSLAFKRKLEVVVFVILTPSPHHHLPSIQTRAGGGSFRCFDMFPTTTTSLASKREPEEIHFIISTCLPPPPPPSFRNASWRWFISPFRCASHHYYLPRIQARAGGGPFQRFQGIRRHRHHIITTRESITAKIDKRGRGRRK